MTTEDCALVGKMDKVKRDILKLDDDLVEMGIARSMSNEYMAVWNKLIFAIDSVDVAIERVWELAEE